MARRHLDAPRRRGPRALQVRRDEHPHRQPQVHLPTLGRHAAEVRRARLWLLGPGRIHLRHQPCDDHDARARRRGGLWRGSSPSTRSITGGTSPRGRRSRSSRRRRWGARRASWRCCLSGRQSGARGGAFLVVFFRSCFFLFFDFFFHSQQQPLDLSKKKTIL